MKRKLCILLSLSTLFMTAAIPAMAEDRITAFSEDFEGEYDPAIWDPAIGSDPVFITENNNTFYSVTATDYVKFEHVDSLKNFTVEFDMNFGLDKSGVGYPSFYLKSMGEPTR